MRVLLGCSLGGSGHLLPVVTAADALERLGHETLVIVPPSLEDRARDAGLTIGIGGQPPKAVVDAVWDRYRRGPPEAIDRELFADRGATAMLPAVEAAVRNFEPDLILREPTEYATATVAHRAGIPQAQVAISQARIEDGVLTAVSDLLEPRSPGLTESIRASPYLTRFPASLDPSPWRDTRRFREPVQDAAPAPDWWPGDDRPLVYLTFGTVFGRLPEAARIYATAADALGALPVRVLMTLGPEAPVPTGLPANVHAERWVPQAAVLAGAQLVVCHGGSGTVFGALAQGVPLVVCPFFADQSANGRAVESAGAGAMLAEFDAERLRTLTQALLTSQPHRAAARRIAAEMRATPTIDAVVADLLPR